MNIGRSISTQIAVHAALTKTHGVATAIEDTGSVITHAALKTGVHAVGSDYLPKTSQSNQSLSDAEIPAAIARDAEVSDAITAHSGAADPHGDRAYAVSVLYNEGARVYHSADQSISNATETALAFDSERYDTDAIHDPSTNNSRLTCKTAGKYIIAGEIIFASNTTGLRSITIYLNGVTRIALHGHSVAVTGGDILTVATEYNLAVDDYVELMVYQNSTGALNVTAAANHSPEFAMQRIG